MSTPKERFEDAYQRFQLCDQICALDMKKLWAFISKEIALAYEQGRNAKGSSFRLGYEAMRSEVVAEERDRMRGEIENTPIDKAHTYSSENADEYRTFDNGQESYKQKLLSSLDKPLTDK